MLETDPGLSAFQLSTLLLNSSPKGFDYIFLHRGLGCESDIKDEVGTVPANFYTQNNIRITKRSPSEALKIRGLRNQARL